MTDIQNPQTYAEWWWKNSVDASELNAEHIEKVLSPVAAELLSMIPTDVELPPVFASLIEGLREPKDPGWDNVLVRFVSNVSSGLLNRVLGHEIKEFDYHMASYLQNVLMTPDVANNLMLRRKITPELWLDRMQQGGYKESEANLLYETMKPYPSMPDLITFARYAGDPFNPKQIAWSLFDISPSDWPVWEWLSRMKLNTEQVQTLFKRGVMTTTESEMELGRLGWQTLDNHHIRSLAFTFPNAMIAVQGDLMQGKSREFILDDISKCDIHPTYAETYLDAVMTKPASMDLVAYALRQDPSLTQLGPQLERIGIHPAFTDVYKTLAYQIPPVQDIITMAVREAFTPAIAARFGQYEDYPDPLTEWAGKKGLSKEWAERYWASHWSLPSPQQGFEMLHRGKIGMDDLHLLLRASDVMPFWRDKLIEIAYRPLTRVDVRRMYALGVIDVDGVRKAYTDLGYNDYNADLMTRFTIEYVKGTPRKLSTTDMVSAYKKHLIEAGTLRNLLSQAGIESDDIEPIVKTAHQKREWSDKDAQIDTLEFSYKQGKQDENTTISELSALGLDSDYVTALISQWRVRSIAEKDTLWTTAQVLSFYKAKLIEKERAVQELDKLGYNDEHINVYIASVKRPA